MRLYYLFVKLDTINPNYLPKTQMKRAGTLGSIPALARCEKLTPIGLDQVRREWDHS